jgi:hypothetical protein
MTKYPEDLISGCLYHRRCNEPRISVCEVKPVTLPLFRCQVVTMRTLFALFTLLLSCPAIGIAAETSNLAFVTEYVRELGANENSRAQAEREIAEPTDKNATMIRNSTRIVLELTSQIGMLKGISLGKPFDELPSHIAEFYRYKIETHNELIALATTFMSGPKPGVDYSLRLRGLPSLPLRLSISTAHCLKQLR